MKNITRELRGDYPPFAIYEATGQALELPFSVWNGDSLYCFFADLSSAIAYVEVNVAFLERRRSSNFKN